MLLKIYTIGVICTFIWNLYWAIYRLLTKKSLLDRNMSLIGLRKSMISGNYIAGGNIYKELSILFLFMILTSFASWIGLCFEVGNSLHSFFKNQGEPQPLKEIKWKLKNTPLTPSGVAKLDIQATEIQSGHKFTKEQLNKIQGAYLKKGLNVSLKRSYV